MKRTERQIYIYDVSVRSRSRHAVPPPLSDVIVALRAAVDGQLAVIERDRGTIIYRIGELEVDDIANTVTLLIRRGDTNASNAVYSHRVTGASRVAEREEDEVGDRAAHLVISLVSESARPGRYLAHLEGVPAIGHRVVQALLNRAVSQATKNNLSFFSYDDPAGARDHQGSLKTHPFVPLIELLGHPHENLINDLEQGTVSQITLIDARPKGQLGGNQYLEEREHIVQVKVDSAMPAGNRLAGLIGAARTRRASFQTAAIRFKDPQGHNRTVKFDIDSGNPEQLQYLASYDISGVAPPLNDSSDHIVVRLADQIKRRIQSDRS
ncbi:hypothetical protein [Novosphingobium sp.]|uniref:hypothetical protein n=1 Tax=Novosphingobium sp. TaxID=1874826 RepID=UPI00286A1362|nr:hypothetical protein [Novosphingobium sp.]